MKYKAKDITQRVVDLLKQELNPERIILFGSRAKGSAKPYSDIDVAIEGGKTLDYREKRKLKEKIGDISGIYTVDLVFLDGVEDDFAEIIKKQVGFCMKKEEVIKSYDKLRKSFETLREAVLMAETPLEIGGTLQRFEYTFETF